MGQTDVDLYQDVQVRPFVDFSDLDSVLVLVRQEPLMLAAGAKATVLLFFAVVVQVTIFGTIGVLGGSPDLVLVILVAIALLNGAVFGAISGFWAGLLLDVSLLGTLGFTSLLLTLAGFWVGRYGETTGRGRAHAPLVSVAVVTMLYAIGSLILHFMLGDPVSREGRARRSAAARGRAEPDPGVPGLRPVSPAPRPGRATSARWSSLASTGARLRPGRFLPPDPRAKTPYRLTPQMVFRIGILGFLVIVAFAILFFRLWALQVLSGRSTSRRPRTTSCARSGSRRTGADSRLARAGGRRQRGRNRDPRLAFRPARQGRYGELKRLARILGVPLGDITKQIEEHKGAPGTPVTVKQDANEPR